MKSDLRFRAVFLLLVLMAAGIITISLLAQTRAIPQGKIRPRVVFGAYYSIQHDYVSVLGLNNSTKDPLTVFPTLYSHSGERAVMAPVIVAAHQHIQINLNDWLAPLGGNFRTGSIQLAYESFLNALGAQILVQDEGHSLSLDVPVHGRHEFKSRNLEAIWWAYDRQSEMDLAIANTTDSEIRATVRVTSENGGTLRQIPVPLGPHHSRLINLRSIVGSGVDSQGGISIEHDGPPGGIMAEGFITQRAKGFTSNLRFLDPGGFGGNKLHGAGVYLPAGRPAFRGHLLLRNISGESVAVKPILRDGDEEISLGEHVIEPGASKKLTVADRVVGAGDEPTAVEVSYTGLPGGLIGQWVSVDESGNMVVETPLRNPGPISASSGSNPFMIAGDFESVLFVKNTGAGPSSFIGIIYYGSEQYMVGIVTVEPGKAVAIDVRKLRDERVPDVFGRLLPLDIESGQFQWLHRSGPRMVGRMRIVSRSKGMSTNMSCGWCLCGPLDVWYELNPSSVSALVGASVQESVYETTMNCEYQTSTLPVSPGLMNWGTSNPLVATPNPGGEVTCWSPGIAWIVAGRTVATEQEGFTECESGPCERNCVSDEHWTEATAIYSVSAPPPPPPVTTDDVVVVAWVDPRPIGLPGGANQQLIDELNSPLCGPLVGTWAAGFPRLLNTDEDRAYANAFLVKWSYNQEPPLGINPTSFLASGDFRLFSRFKVRFTPSGGKITSATFLESNATVGNTPDPCGILSPISGEAHPANGAKGLTPSETAVYQLTEGRIGGVGQAVNLTINGRTAAFIWNVIRFDPSGTLNVSDRAIFPTYYVYKNGQLVLGFNQSATSAFIALDSTYQRQPGQIQ